MQTIQSRLYMNVILTVIAILLAAIAFRPVMRFATPALAQDATHASQNKRFGELQGGQYQETATATLQVADANRDIAKAIREAAKSQSEIAKAIGHLSEK